MLYSLLQHRQRQGAAQIQGQRCRDNGERGYGCGLADERGHDAAAGDGHASSSGAGTVDSEREKTRNVRQFCVATCQERPFDLLNGLLNADEVVGKILRVRMRPYHNLLHQKNFLQFYLIHTQDELPGS